MIELEEMLAARDINPTAMRLLVLRKLKESDHALGLPELEVLFENADKTTLYRTLKTFKEHKLVHSIDDGTGSVKYSLCDESCECLPEEAHLHFHCTNCQLTYCMRDYALPKISLPKNFTAKETEMVVKGLCDNCS